MAPHLSICIPTYNRAGFLEATLGRLAAQSFPFPVEIVVSDNASPDRTPQVAFAARQALPGLRYFRQGSNLGMTANYLAACRMATGEFLIYLGDDDAVDAEELARAVGVVARDPSLAAYYSPHEYWDFRSGRRFGRHWTIPEDRFFEPKQGFDLLAFVLEHRINPEVGVYRRAALQRVLRAADGAYWAYTVLAALTAEARIGLSARCYYRFDSRAETSGINANAGRRIVTNAYREIRTGLEYLVAKTQERAGLPPLRREEAFAWRDRIDAFINAGLADTFLALILAQDYLAAHDLACRLEASGWSARALVHQIDAGFEERLVADFVLHSCAAMSWVDTLLVSSSLAIAGSVQALAQKREIAVAVAGPEELAALARSGASLSSKAILLARGEGRDALVALGYVPGLIFAEDEIRRFLKLPLLAEQVANSATTAG